MVKKVYAVLFAIVLLFNTSSFVVCAEEDENSLDFVVVTIDISEFSDFVRKSSIEFLEQNYVEKRHFIWEGTEYSAPNRGEIKEVSYSKDKDNDKVVKKEKFISPLCL